MTERSEAPDIIDMYQEARQQLAVQGLEDSSLSPDVIVLATNKPKEVHRAINDGEIGAVVSEILSGHSTLPQNRAKQLAGQLDSLTTELSRRRRRAWQVGVLAASVACGAGFMIVKGKGDYDYFGNQLVGKPLVRHTSLVSDPSIMPGSHGKDVPILGDIPGIPDFAKARIRTTEYLRRVIITKQAVEGETTDQKSALNPLSPDLQLTGQEIEQDRQLADELLKYLKRKHMDVKSVRVTGLASDDFGNRVGRIDPPQKRLALARAQVAADTLVAEAMKLNVDLPSSLHITGHEAVLSKSKQAELTQLAESTGETSEQLIADFNAGRLISKSANNFLVENLAANRAALIEVHGERKIHKTEKKTVYKFVKTNELLGDVPGEVIFGIGALPILFIGTFLAAVHRHGRYVRNRAKRMVAKEGFQI